MSICQGSVAGLLAVRYGSVGGQSKSSMEVNLRARWWSVEGVLDIHLGLLSVLFLEGVHWLVHLSIFGVSCGWSIGRQFREWYKGVCFEYFRVDTHWRSPLEFFLRKLGFKCTYLCHLITPLKYE